MVTEKPMQSIRIKSEPLPKISRYLYLLTTRCMANSLFSFFQILTFEQTFFDNITKKNEKKLKFYGPFLWMSSTASWLEPLRGGSLLFTAKFPEIPGTHFIDLGKMKD